MLKKQLRSRLNQLFNNLEGTATPVLQQETTLLASGWSWESNMQGEYTVCSPQVADCLGVSPHEFIGHAVSSFLLPPESAAQLAHAFAVQAFPFEVELRYQPTTGKRLRVRMSVYAQFNAEGVQIGCSGFNQVIADEVSLPPMPLANVPPPIPPLVVTTPPSQLSQSTSDSSLAILGDTFTPAREVWTRTAAQSLLQQKTTVSQPEDESPSTLAVPFQVGSRGNGLFEIVDENTNRRWSEDELLLVQDVTNQLALALENANLYSEVRGALSAIEDRERYQANMANAVSLLTEQGSKSMPEVLAFLGKASQTDHVYFAQTCEDNQSLYWQLVAEWVSPQMQDQEHTQDIHIPVNLFPYLTKQLRSKGQINTLVSKLPSPEREFFQDRKIKSILALAINSPLSAPSFVIFEDRLNERKWQIEEIAVLQVAANAISNTITREDLLKQVQQSYQETQVALSETEHLYQVTAGISEAVDAQSLVNLVAKQILPDRADRVSLLSVSTTPDGDPISMEIIGYYDVAGEYQRIGLVIPSEALPILRQLTTEMMNYADIANSTLDPISKRTLAQLDIRSGFVIPLRSAGRLNGVMVIASRQKAEFTEEDTRLLQAAGNGIAIVLERQKLLREAQRRALELQTAAEIARDTTSTLSLDLLLSRMVNLLCDRFGFYHASIFLLDEQSTFAVIRESTGEAGKEMKRRGHKLSVGSRSIIGSVTASGRPIIVNNVNQSPVYYPNPLLPDTQSEMGIALKLGDRVIGALDLQSTEANAFNPSDVAVIQILADQIAVAIDNARAYELAQKAFEEMQEVDRLKSQFLANMSHELRTPLNSIIGFSRVIIKGIDGPINDVQKQDLTAIYNSGQHLLSLITDILDLSKIEAGKMELQFSDVNIADMINSAMSTAVGLVKDRPVKLVHIVPPDLPTVRADATRVRQVIINFISNASKFTDQGTITVEAKLITSPENNPEVMFTVADTGIGIAEADHAKLFQPFSQVDDSPTRKTGGTGLGLSICRSLIEMHGGRIGLLNSEVGKGSTFYFTLPMPKVEPEPVFQPTQQELVILSIEDDPQVISLYERYLQPQGYHVIPLTDPRQAVARAKEIKPFAITLDIMMPEKDGWQTLQTLKNDPATHNIPVIICSILEEEEKGLSLGASDYLVKPFLQEDLITAVGRLGSKETIHNILVIDDDPADLRLVEKMLQDNKQFSVELAEGGEQGWQKMHEHKPDAIILDLFMPKMNGFALLGKMREEAALNEIPVIILSGADLTPEQHQLLSDYGKQLLSKGFLREKDLLYYLGNALKKLSRTPSE